MTRINPNIRSDEVSLGAVQDVSHALGWFSIGLGLMELMAPKALARGLGMEASAPVLRAYGARELATGIGILTTNNPKPWMWGRVGGDALDLATLATGLRDDNPKKNNVWLAMAAVAGVTAVDMMCAKRLGTPNGSYRRAGYDYSDRSGFPDSPQAMRGAASNFEAPQDMRTPEALRPYAAHQ